ncbi:MULTISPECIES: hypothetical protein [Rhizobium]|uniref:hypothetical protein n=1 Tax=Rhizobium TaxID=379 RepID=UPI0007EA5163|nr:MULTISPECIES: hypothetical protein [Rhizobium]
MKGWQLVLGGERLSKPFATVVQLFNPDAIVVVGFFSCEILQRLGAGRSQRPSTSPAGGR